MNTYRVLAWDDEVVLWIAEIAQELQKLRPDWSLHFDNPDGVTEEDKNLAADWAKFLTPLEKGGASDVQIHFDVYHSREAEQADFTQYSAAVLDDVLKDAGDLSPEEATHYGSQVLARRIVAANGLITVVVASQYAGSYNPADVLEEAHGNILMYVDKQDLMIEQAPAVRRCLAGLIVAAVAKQQAAETAEGLSAALDTVGADIGELSTPIPAESFGDGFIVGDSQELKNLARRIQVAADMDFSVLIRGEAGTGKERVARSIHALWQEKAAGKKPYVVLECTSVTHTLFESEVFGHVKGAFTGATENKTGLVEKAGDGILFLDEIGDIALEQQKKLLRLLEEHEYRPVGATEWKKSKARIVMATNRNLEEMKAAGEFREDLYSRLVRGLRIPTVPLRRATEAIPALVKDYVAQEAPTAGLPRDLPIAVAVFRELARYDWPANVRDLQGVIIHNLVELRTRGLDKWEKVFWPEEINCGTEDKGAPIKVDDHSQDTGKDGAEVAEWLSGIDAERLLELAREVWRTRGACISNDPDTVLAGDGAPYLRGVLALMKGSLRTKFGYRGWKAEFDGIFGFGAGNRASVSLSQYLQNISRQSDYRKYFTPRAGREQFGAMDVDADAVALENAGIRLEIE